MDYYAGIDVSLEQSSVCVLDAGGKIVREAKVASEPEALIAWLGSLGLAMTRIMKAPEWREYNAREGKAPPGRRRRYEVDARRSARVRR